MGKAAAGLQIVWLQGNGQPGHHSNRRQNIGSPSIPLYPFLFPAKFDTRQFRQRLPAPWQRLANFQPSGLPRPPFPGTRAKPGVVHCQSDRSTCHWQVAQAVLWHPASAGGGGDPRTGSCPIIPAPRQASVVLSAAARGGAHASPASGGIRSPDTSRVRIACTGGKRDRGANRWSRNSGKARLSD